MLPDSLLGLAGRSFPDFGLGDQQPQHAFQIILIAAPEGETRSVHQFAILGNIAGQDANPCSHGIEQGQGKAFQIGGQDEIAWRW